MKRFSKLGLALVAVFAVGLVGCSQSGSNPLNSSDADLMTTRVGVATADAAGGSPSNTGRPMPAMKRTGPHPRAAWRKGVGRSRVGTSRRQSGGMNPRWAWR